MTVRSNRSAAALSAWSDEAVRSERCAAIKARQSTPEYKAAKSVEMASSWRNPAHRAARVAGMAGVNRGFLWIANGVVFDTRQQAAAAMGVSRTTIGSTWLRDGWAIRLDRDAATDETIEAGKAASYSAARLYRLRGPRKVYVPKR